MVLNVAVKGDVLKKGGRVDEKDGMRELLRVRLWEIPLTVCEKLIAVCVKVCTRVNFMKLCSVHLPGWNF
jgi:hypothetical protein